MKASYLKTLSLRYSGPPTGLGTFFVYFRNEYDSVEHFTVFL